MDMTNVALWVLFNLEAPKSSGMDVLGNRILAHNTKDSMYWYGNADNESARLACRALLRVTELIPNMQLTARDAQDEGYAAQAGGSGIFADIFFETAVMLEGIESFIRGY